MLKVKHVIVMGHYGCGGIAASMVSPPEQEGPTPRSADIAVQNWIYPIRQIYQTSSWFVNFLSFCLVGTPSVTLTCMTIQIGNS